MVNRSKGLYNNLSPASFYRIICHLLKKKPSSKYSICVIFLISCLLFNRLQLSGIVNLIHSDMSKVILSSLPDHLKTKLDYIPKTSQLDPDTLGYMNEFLTFTQMLMVFSNILW